jgi:hypothetical protein
MGDMSFSSRESLSAVVAAIQARQPLEPRTAYNPQMPEYDRMPWPESWFRDMSDPGDFRLCQALWARVLKETLSSCLLNRFGRRGTPTKEPTVGWRWIGSEDFHIVCEHAGLDGQSVYETVAPLLRDEGEGEALAMARRLAAIGASGRGGGAGA